MSAYFFLKISTRFPIQYSSFDISNCKIQTLVYYVPHDKYVMKCVGFFCDRFPDGHATELCEEVQPPR